MSSSEEDIPFVVKAVKRRKRVLNQDHMNQPVNLYSHKIEPLLKQVDERILHQMNNNKEFVAIGQAVANQDTSEQDSSLLCPSLPSDDDVQIIGEESPIKARPITPPPVEKVINKNPSTVERKRKRLLKNVAAVRSHAQPTELLNESIDDGSNVLSEECHDYLMVKVRFHSTVFKFPHEKHLSFSPIFSELASKHHTSKDLLIMTLNDCTINPSDTPTSVGMTVADIIDCVLVNKDVLAKSQQSSKCKSANLQIHFQCIYEKTKQSFNVNKYQPLQHALQSYAASIRQTLNDLSFQFDGDVISASSTPEELELETGDCIDVLIKHTK